MVPKAIAVSQIMFLIPYFTPITVSQVCLKHTHAVVNTTYGQNTDTGRDPVDQLDPAGNVLKEKKNKITKNQQKVATCSRSQGDSLQ